MTRLTRRRSGRILTVLLALGALVATPVVAEPEAELLPAANAVTCESDHSSTEFGGAAVSWRYGNEFNRSTEADSFLTTHTPQGLGVWEDWNGGTEDVFLIAMHHHDENNNNSLVYAVTPGGTYRGSADLPVGSHAGGLKVHSGWMYVQHDNDTIYRWPLDNVRTALTTAGTGAISGRREDTVYGVSFFDIDAGHLYGGYHDPDSRGTMRRWAIDGASGALTRDWDYGPIEIPMKAQGVLVLSNTFVFSTSRFRDWRGNIYVVRRGYGQAPFDSVTHKCFQSVAMIQELVGFNGNTYLLNESGSSEFADGRIHNIRHLHVAGTESLRSLVW